MTSTRPSGAHPDRAGDRDHNPPRAWGELRPDELTRIREARASLAASGVRVSMAGAVRLYRMHALDLDAAAVLTRPDHRGAAVPVDPEAERLAGRLARQGVTTP